MASFTRRMQRFGRNSGMKGMGLWFPTTRGLIGLVVAGKLFLMQGFLDVGINS